MVIDMMEPPLPVYSGDYPGTPLALIGYAGVDAIVDRFYRWLERSSITGPYFRDHDVAKIKRGLRPVVIVVLTDPESIDLDKLSRQMSEIHSNVRSYLTNSPITGRVYGIVGRYLIHSIGVEFAPFSEHDAVIALAGSIYEKLRSAIAVA